MTHMFQFSWPLWYFDLMSPNESAAAAVLSVKLFHAALSAAGFIVGLLILYFFKPGITIRMAIVASSALALVTAILAGGDLFAATAVADRFSFLRQAGWFALGLLFGAGRGDKIVKYFPQAKVAKLEKTELETKSIDQTGDTDLP